MHAIGQMLKAFDNGLTRIRSGFTNGIRVSLETDSRLFFPDASSVSLPCSSWSNNYWSGSTSSFSIEVLVVIAI